MRESRFFIKNAVVSSIVLLVLTAGFFVLFEKAERTVTTPSSVKARQNPFLAAERFLTECGIEAQSSAQRQILLQLPHTDTLIFVNRLGGNLPKKREDRLVEWIRNGGMLVITHDRLWRKRLQKSGNSLLDRLGVRQYDALELSTDKAPKEGSEPENPSDSGAKANAEGDPEENLCSMQKKELVRVPVGPDTVAELRFIARYILEDKSKAPSGSYGGKTGSHIIDRRMGRGRLIVLSDNKFLQNTHIDSRDHAFYLARLAHGRDKVFIQYKSRVPSFLAVLWGKAPFFLISLLVFAVFYILWLTIRIGPRYPTDDSVRRDITEHFLAAGRLRWRYDPDGLIKESRAAVGHLLERKMPARTGFEDSKTGSPDYDAIARRAGLSRDAVVFALTVDIDRPAALVKATAILQQINSALLTKDRFP